MSVGHAAAGALPRAGFALGTPPFRPCAGGAVIDARNHGATCPLPLPPTNLDNSQPNVIVVLMVPDFDEDGKLPPGIHLAAWAEVAARFGWNKCRRRLLKGLAAALEVLRTAGCRTVYLDGSFVTNKATPGDYDVAWEPANVDIAVLLRLDPVFGDFAEERAAQKAKYGGEFFPSSVNEALTGRTFLEFFQTDKET